MPLFGRPSERDEARVLAYRQWYTRQHPFALPSLLLSAFSLTHFGTLWVDEIAGISLGVVALVQIARGRARARDVRLEGQWLAIAGIGVGVVSLSVAVLIYFVLRRPQ
jgi:hypothetical protein